jgi:hypothetical protein
MSLQAAYSAGSGAEPVAMMSAKSMGCFIASFFLHRMKKYGRSVWWVLGSTRMRPTRSSTSRPSQARMTSGTSVDFALSIAWSSIRVIP